MYTVVADPNRPLLRIRLNGFWDMNVMMAYTSELLAATRAMQKADGCKFVLVDMGDYPIQSQDVAAAHIEAMRYATGKLGARVALIMRSALSRLQMERMARDTGHSTFRSEEEALAWLLEIPATQA